VREGFVVLEPVQEAFNVAACGRFEGDVDLDSVH